MNTNSRIQPVFWGMGWIVPLFLISIVGFPFGLSGCSNKPKSLISDCQPKFDKLHAKFEKGKYSSAKDGYTEFLTSCAQTEFIEQAFFELAESQYHLEDWSSAEIEYRSFLRAHPSSKRYEEKARFHQALSMAKQVEIPQRDQSKTVEALKEFEAFLADFSESTTYADSLKTEMERLKQLLAKRDELIAKLYFRMDEPLAAVIYYKNLLKEHGSRVPEREISLKMVECYIELTQFLEAEAILLKFDGIAKDDPFRNKVLNLHAQLKKAQDKFARMKVKEKEAALKPSSL